MGQEESKPIDESTPPQTLEKRDVASVAKYINQGKAKRIVVMTGAGISTAAGIPDFRSPDTGLYANLARLNLPYPEAVFDISFFRENPLPFYTLAHELFPGKFLPTLTHIFIRMLSDRGLLLKLFTQNIDCLERDAGVPGDKIVEAHGSFASHSCIECKADYPDELMRKTVQEKGVPRCLQCEGLVKPNIVFFGEQLPENFHLNRTLPAAADLCIVMGTSLTVQPFASLPGLCKEEVPRVLINLERVGSLGSRPDDVLILDECDAGVRKLARALGWLEELEQLYKEIHPDKAKEDFKEAEEQKMTKDVKLENEVEKLTTDIEKALKLSNSHESRVRDELSIEKNDAKEETNEEEAKTGRLEIPSVRAETGNKETQTDSTAPVEGEVAKQEGLQRPDDDHDVRPVDSRV